MKVGDMVKRRPLTFHEYGESGDGKAPGKAMTGRVVYIHPLGRYHVVEFELRGGPVRESFLGVNDDGTD